MVGSDGDRQCLTAVAVLAAFALGIFIKCATALAVGSHITAATGAGIATAPAGFATFTLDLVLCLIVHVW
jgi:hypothetical protein